MLSKYRCLDLANENGLYCGKLLADLGCDVIKVETPGGDPARNTGPFYNDVPHPEKSLFWFANNTGKRSVTLDIETSDGQEIFKQMVKRADVVIESFTPGYMDGLGLSYSELSKINPRITVTSITPFGQRGPYEDWRGCDIVVCALSGYMYLCGDEDRAPVRFSVPQAFMHACADAVQAILIALYHAEQTGQGQYVDVSAQESMAWLAATSYFNTREGNKEFLVSYGVRRQAIFPCKDGFVSFSLRGGHIGARTQRALVEWMDSEGKSDDSLNSMNWEEWDLNDATQEEIDRMQEAITRFFLTHTKEELFVGAGERGIILAPVWNLRDLARNPQLDFRKFWTTVEHDELGGTITYPGAFFESSLFPRRAPRRAPLIGEHNDEVYIQEVGLTRGKLIMFKQAGVI